MNDNDNDDDNEDHDEQDIKIVNGRRAVLKRRLVKRPPTARPEEVLYYNRHRHRHRRCRRHRHHYHHYHQHYLQDCKS